MPEKNEKLLESMESVRWVELERLKKYGEKDLWSLEWKREGVMDGDSEWRSV